MKFKLRYRIQNWVSAWADLLVSMIQIVTFGLWEVNWNFKIRFYWSRLNLERRRKEVSKCP